MVEILPDLALLVMAEVPEMVVLEMAADAVGVVVIPIPHKAALVLLVRVTLEIPQALAVNSTVVVVVAENKPVKDRTEEPERLGGGHDIPEVVVEDLVVEQADHTAAAMVVVDPHLVRPHIIGVAVVEAVVI